MKSHLGCNKPNLLLPKNKAICFSRHSEPTVDDSSSYFKGIGILGSAAGRSLSFLMLLSTDFKPYLLKEKSFSMPYQHVHIKKQLNSTLLSYITYFKNIAEY